MFSATGFGILVLGYVLRSRRMIKDHTWCGITALASVAYMTGHVVVHETIGATLWSASAAWFAYKWWTGGGSDGTRKRLRKIAERFTPTRRTAPQGA